jgi:hypothetical protein
VGDVADVFDHLDRRRQAEHDASRRNDDTSSELRELFAWGPHLGADAPGDRRLGEELGPAGRAPHAGEAMLEQAAAGPKMP